MTFICCVPGCGEGGKRSLHSFPKNQQQCKKWIRVTWCFFLNEETAWRTHHKVCRKHFQETDFKNWNLLNKGVVPSLKLPHSITMEHAYCTRNSIVMNANVVDEINVIAETNNNNSIVRKGDCFSEDHIMEVGEVVSLVSEMNGSQHSIVVDEINVPVSPLTTNKNLIVCTDSCLSEDHIMEVAEMVNQVNDINGSEFLFKSHMYKAEFDANLLNDPSVISSDDRTSLISKQITVASVDEKVMGEESITDNRNENSVPSAVIHRLKSTYNHAARKMRYLSERNKTLAKKLKEIQSANLKSNKKSKVKKKINNVLKTLALELPPAHFNFIKLQIKNTGKAKNGNRFTLEEKTLALVIYKQNPKRYKDLLKMAYLPTRRTLITHSAAIRFKEGINENLMDFMRKEVSEMGELDKVCTIGWDEMSLTANLNFDRVKDYIDGFEDLASKRTNDFATHALVFMVRGIKTAFKQPIAYFLTQNLNASELAELIRLVIQAVTDIGFKIVGSVCDAVNTNRAAVNKLIYPNRGRANTTGELLEYSINGVKIWHYFDPPHLIKSVRNNLLVKNLGHNVSFNETKFRPNGEIVWNLKSKQQRFASWKDVDDFYHFNTDCNTGLFNLIPKITDEHMNPVRRKMKVSLATQVFSGTYGRNMYLCSKRKQFLNNCLGTSAVLLFFNELFDSVNGNDIVIPDKLIGAVTTKSEHFKFWDYAIRMLDSMKFSENLSTGRPNQSNVCKHFVSTLKGMRRISEHLFELGFESIGLRRLNQDGLENQFFKIRSYCGSNPKPNARDFRNSCTTAILNNQWTSHSLNANCEADGDKYVLQNFYVLFDTKPDPISSSNSESNNISVCAEQKQRQNCDKAMKTLKDETDSSKNEFPEDEAQNCIAGKLCQKLVKKNKCASCIASVTVTTKKGMSIEQDIMRKQSSVDELLLPKVRFIDCIKTIISYVEQMLPVLCAEKNLMKKLNSGLSFACKNDELGCDDHRIEFVDEMKKCTAELVIERFTQQVNRILSGKITVATKCIIQKKALSFKVKKKNIGKFVPPISERLASSNIKIRKEKLLPKALSKKKNKKNKSLNIKPQNQA